MTRLSLAAPAAAAPPDSAADVAPIRERHCVRCHQPGSAMNRASAPARVPLGTSK